MSQARASSKRTLPKKRRHDLARKKRVRPGNYRTELEKRRIRAVKVTILLIFILLLTLSIWQCAEKSLEQSSVLDFAAILSFNEGGGDCVPGSEQASGSLSEVRSQPTDPLALGQDGIVFMEMNEEGSIYWYQSIWDVPQSRVLLERALVIQGWHSLNATDEQFMSFVYPTSNPAGGSSLLISFYPLEEGSSILIEVL